MEILTMKITHKDMPGLSRLVVLVQKASRTG